jgi:hypothetical protein
MGFALTKFGRTVFTLTEIMIVVAVIVLHVASTIPAFLRPRKRMNSVEIPQWRSLDWSTISPLPSPRKIIESRLQY